MSLTLVHFNRLKAAHGISVQVRRGNRTWRDEFYSVKMVPAKSVAQLVGDNGSYTEVVVDDWLVAVSDWPFTEANGAHIVGPPERADEIEVDESTRYRIGHPDEKTPVYANFNQLDRPALVWRIHSIQRDSA